MIKISVNISEKKSGYEIIVGKDLLNSIDNFIPQIKEGLRIALITDSNVKPLYGMDLLNLLHKYNSKSMIFSFEAGEKNKTRKIKEEIENQLLVAGYNRDSLILALGGGVTGDISGFIASTYYRGIPFYQIPTTIIAMTDSSIGGKTGVDTVYGKNLIGAFYQPKGIIADINTLQTLPDIEYFQGMAEVIKYGIINDKEFFYFIKDNINKIINKDEDILQKIIQKSCDNKRIVVEEDEKEKGLRKILNFGHTIGHGIEVINDYNISHGTAIAYGMIIESILLEKSGKLPNKDLIEIIDLIINLPLKITHNCPVLELKKLLAAVKYDKKVQQGRVPNVIVNGIGKYDNEKITMDIDNTLLEKSLNQFLTEHFKTINCIKKN